ncbi:transcriptional regulator, LuxR family [Methylocella silvestris BL2]|uniref:Transcriptional regulator, LuxR family n=1 Tax=Methylocella silvestris (strain DSM 15510 / CIP 108128 / LMG 27833 / NCIMB 13906 / BL2) TaxID=395965 RepID=B8EP77_METSB|nr:LuxR family transcriptional regulator [Methylocella silvestris]ACK49665.1 transcriptional regulator, LuxR family [Methylocella silvestris BL2]
MANQEPLEQIQIEVAESQLNELLGLVRRIYDLHSLIYLCPSFMGHSLSEPFIVQPTCPGWADRQKIQSQLLVDSMTSAIARAVLPMDWAQLRRRSAQKRGIHFLPNSLGNNRQGVTIPVRGPSGGYWALLIATSNETHLQWTARRHELTKDLVQIAYYVHARACDLHGVSYSADAADVTSREIEALQFMAEGKMIVEIATRMRVSQSTVLALLESARVKLHALNRAHAAAKALGVGLISKGR